MDITTISTMVGLFLTVAGGLFKFGQQKQIIDDNVRRVEDLTDNLSDLREKVEAYDKENSDEFTEIKVKLASIETLLLEIKSRIK